eukprot:CAMPEP_0174269390 /NCGR_PEP_ID=MMETSP0439-20130205/40776_1 /TAXON_ID=0 /ORGANISM="Stereomyxa ramosa, Strain Chinc5" /LENGTH=125 /DNA_ID=CAMNT_0015358125 /DNA_START=171 /DNA_END=545 /DNA_ORIENTATION=+
MGIKDKQLAPPTITPITPPHPTVDQIKQAFVEDLQGPYGHIIKDKHEFSQFELTSPFSFKFVNYGEPQYTVSIKTQYKHLTDQGNCFYYSGTATLRLKPKKNPPPGEDVGPLDWKVTTHDENTIA